MQNLGFEVLLTILTPGLIALTALCLFVDYQYPAYQITGIAKQVASLEWQLSLVAVVGSAFIGAIIASIIGYLEGYVLDPLQAWRLGMSRDEFDREWTSYVDSLEKGDNPYMGRHALYFFFETRAGVAALFLGAVLLFWTPTAGNLWIGGSIAALGVGLFYAGVDDHYALARFRHRRFSKTADADPTIDGDLANLLNTWCVRRDYDLVRAILQQWPNVDGKLRDALHQAREQLQTRSAPRSEIAVVRRMIHLLDAGVSPAP